MTEPNPHLWRPYTGPEDHEEICHLCEAFPNTPAGEAPCVEAFDMTEWFASLWQLIFTDDPAEIARLEAVAGATQTEAVDHFIEHSCWERDLPAFVGGKGNATERREALRSAYRANRLPG